MELLAVIEEHLKIIDFQAALKIIDTRSAKAKAEQAYLNLEHLFQGKYLYLDNTIMVLSKCRKSVEISPRYKKHAFCRMQIKIVDAILIIIKNS